MLLPLTQVIVTFLAGAFVGVELFEGVGFAVAGAVGEGDGLTVGAVEADGDGLGVGVGVAFASFAAAIAASSWRRTTGTYPYSIPAGGFTKRP